MNQNLPNSFRSGPDERGHFGIFGGRFVAETLMPLILELEQAYKTAKNDPAFQAEITALNDGKARAVRQLDLAALDQPAAAQQRRDRPRPDDRCSPPAR